MRYDTHTVNTITANKLTTEQSTTQKNISKLVNGAKRVEFGVRVYRVTSDGTKYELTDGTPEAMVGRDMNGEGLQEGTFECTATPLQTTDAVYVELYRKFSGYDWEKVDSLSFITEQLLKSKLHYAVWSIWYYTYRWYFPSINKTEGKLYYGNSTYNSRIENFSTVDCYAGNKHTTRIKAKIKLTVIRNGEIIHQFKRKRDLLVWRGQMILAYLLSQGAVGTATASWKILASENSNTPDMSDDSGNPETNEFNPLIGTPVTVTYDFNPTVKQSGGYQTYADLMIKATIISDGSKTLRKIGIIDTVAVPDRHIVVADSVVPFNVVLNDEIDIQYTVQLG